MGKVMAPYGALITPPPKIRETQAQRFLRGALWADRFTEDLS
ncbi:hypothetical protein LEP1GSC036_1503 [Leptospira weilii str. 2006001853]|uniref:Uncharacterized protein n=1 Tax=Leptospira weilii str. 2006001853 TaxID=1001589 RepID=A0A828ZA00_9LEPT|nr:hypothetical protein LEP1GSC036_1503 [Leptospira weilii str. 2006001853]